MVFGLFGDLKSIHELLSKSWDHSGVDNCMGWFLRKYKIGLSGKPLMSMLNRSIMANRG